MDKRFLAILAAIVIIFVGIFAFSKKSGTSNSSSGGGGSSQATNHVEGLGQKGVTLTEYGDYECPVCENYYLAVKQVQAKYNNDIYFQFRNLPLSSIHPNAYIAARAAEAAGLQNKYFEMHDMLYENANWSVWSTAKSPASFFQNYAQQLGLDLNKFNSDMNGTHVNDLINADMAEFKKTGQEQATPTFFINGKYVSNTDLVDNNGPSVAKFSAKLDAAIAAKH